MFLSFTKCVLELCRNDIATNNHTGFDANYFYSPTHLTINQPKSPILFLYFRHEPINKFNVTLRSRPLLVRVKVINLPRKTAFPLSYYKTKRSVILIHRPILFLIVDKRSVERTIVRGQHLQICHSLRCKQVDTSTADQLISNFPNNTETRLSTFRSKCRDVELVFDFSSRKVRLILVAVSTW